LGDEPVKVCVEGFGFSEDGDGCGGGLELACFADELGPRFEDGEDGYEVAGEAGDGAPVVEGDDVEA